MKGCNQGTAKPGEGGLQAKCSLPTRSCSACVPLVFRLYSAYTPPVRPTRPGGEKAGGVASPRHRNLVLTAVVYRLINSNRGSAWIQQFSLWDEWDEWDEWRMIIRGLEHPKGWTPNLPDQPK